jgi:hypothetical protein
MPIREDAFVRWSRYADQQWHVFEQGQDFDRDPGLVTRAARMWASRNGFRSQAEILRDQGTRVRIRFLPRSER